MKKRTKYFPGQSPESIREKRHYRIQSKNNTGQQQLTLVQTNLWENEAQAKKLMCWYAAKRNERLTHDIQYSMNPVQLKGKVILRNGWETELIRRTGEMNRIS